MPFFTSPGSGRRDAGSMVVACEFADQCPVGQKAQQQERENRQRSQELSRREVEQDRRFRERDKNLSRRESELNQRVSRVKDRERKVSLREATTAEREAVLAARAAELSRQQEASPEVERRGQELSAQIDALTRRRDVLMENIRGLEQELVQTKQTDESRRQELEIWQARLEKWNEELSAREEGLPQLQEELARREAELTAEREMLDSRKAELDGYEQAAHRYQRERQLWEDRQSSLSAIHPVMEQGVVDVRGQFMAARDALTGVQSGLRALIEAVNHSGRGGVAELCLLYRELSLVEGDQVRCVTDKMGAILRSEFEALPIEPLPGGDFDPAVHERIDASCRGSRIKRCLARGWSWKGETLLRAVTETE